uniref:Uncharacterized protein n=1 Tax=Anopheles atroparvus TaxID=41427 RepID=A0AAG5DCK5_ANOAO
MGLEDPKLQAIKNEHFGLVINVCFVADLVLGLGPHFNALTVVLFSAGLSKLTADFVGNTRAISTVLHLMIGGRGMKAFGDRLKNFLFSGVENVISTTALYAQASYYERFFPPDHYPKYSVVRMNVSLVLLNTHFSQSMPRLYLPNVIEVGGPKAKIKAKPDQLPKDIHEWLDGVGVVYFCLGSNLKSNGLPG